MALKDTQSEKDTRGIDIDRVGIKELRVPMRVAEKNGTTRDTVATCGLTVDLPRHFKGTHMSRFVEVLEEDGSALSPKSLPVLLGKLRERLDSDRAHADFEFPYFLRKTAPTSGSSSLMDYTVRFNATDANGEVDLIVTVIVHVTTLCPCSKAISTQSAHNQRGKVTFAVRMENFVWFEDLIAMVEQSASSELYALLKRPDEKTVTERAYDNPVFVEDLVRNIALRAKEHPEITWYRIEAENFESIHNHNAFAMIESPLTTDKT
jgi:GTP cyclohydrolase I